MFCCGCRPLARCLEREVKVVRGKHTNWLLLGADFVRTLRLVEHVGSIARPGRRRRARAGECYRALVPKSEGQILRGVGRHGTDRQRDEEW